MKQACSTTSSFSLGLDVLEESDCSEALKSLLRFMDICLESCFRNSGPFTCMAFAMSSRSFQRKISRENDVLAWWDRCPEPSMSNALSNLPIRKPTLGSRLELLDEGNDVIPPWKPDMLQRRIRSERSHHLAPTSFESSQFKLRRARRQDSAEANHPARPQSCDSTSF